MDLLSELSRDVDRVLSHVAYPSAPRGLYEPVEYTMNAGGKRIRPLLVLAAARAFGADIEAVAAQCIGIEMFHNFTLLHDDVMDNSDMRRGRPTVHRRWNENTAILSGDTMLTLATKYIADCDARCLRKVLDVFNTTAIEVYEGQQLDMDFEERSDVTVEEYLEMIRLKTSVLLGCALKIGAVIAGASDADSRSLYNYGIALGLGFQLRDDYLDTFGNPEIFGKNIGGDILNDKKTWLAIMADAEDSESMMAIRRLHLDERTKIEAVTNLYRRLGLDLRILELIKHYSGLAVAEIDNVVISDSMRDFFITMARRLNDRMS